MKFILATGNPHKVEEFNQLFDPQIIQVSSIGEKVSVEESGETFHANALLKAQAFFKAGKTPTLADDSGIVVSSLPQDLGIHSARFGGAGLDDKGRAELLLKKMEGVKDRAAYFTCVLCFYLSPGEIYYFEGRLEGVIGHEYIGEFGFGYDPVFIPNDADGSSTLAMVPDWKKSFSHRSKAVFHASIFFKERSRQN